MYNFKILNCLFKILFLRISIKYSFQINCYLKKKKTFFFVSLQKKKNIYFHLSKNLFFLFSNQSISVHQKMLNHSSRYHAISSKLFPPACTGLYFLCSSPSDTHPFFITRSFISLSLLHTLLVCDSWPIAPSPSRSTSLLPPLDRAPPTPAPR